jgi:hypothetical protein
MGRGADPAAGGGRVRLADAVKMFLDTITVDNTRRGLCGGVESARA